MMSELQLRLWFFFFVALPRVGVRRAWCGAFTVRGLILTPKHCWDDALTSVCSSPIELQKTRQRSNLAYHIISLTDQHRDSRKIPSTCLAIR